MHSNWLHALAIVIVVAGCSDEDSSSPQELDPEPLVLKSSVFDHGGTIPPRHRCADAPSPPLSWSGGPAATQSYAVVMRDLDFMNGFLHWIIYDIPKAAAELPEGVPVGYEPGSPPGAKQATVLGQGYYGPCSPSTVNTYEFTLHALDVATLSEVGAGTPGNEVATRIEEHAIDEAKLAGESGP